MILGINWRLCAGRPIPFYVMLGADMTEGENMGGFFGKQFPAMLLLWGYLSVVNLLSFSLMALDKRKARLGRWRIPERTLLLLDLFGGSLGGLLGMALFRHKTKHWRFAVLVPLLFTLQAAALCFFIWKGVIR